MIGIYTLDVANTPNVAVWDISNLMEVQARNLKRYKAYQKEEAMLTFHLSRFVTIGYNTLRNKSITENEFCQ